MKTKPSRCPTCFADLSIVFPEGADGLRKSPPACMACRYKTDCLRQAMQSQEGIGVREAAVDRAYESGSLGFLERWAKKKALQQRRKREGVKSKRNKAVSDEV